jgi:hypothetical protein
MTVQSKLTATLVNNISNGTCHLPSFESSAIIHSVFLNSLQLHWNEQIYKSKGVLPIT